jgi:hypothetical protein
LIDTKLGSNQHRWRTAAKDRAFVPLLGRPQSRPRKSNIRFFGRCKKCAARKRSLTDKFFHFDFMSIKQSQNMPKAKSSKLPEWANDPLTFAVNPDEALKRGAFSNPPKVQDLKKSVCSKSKSRR